MIDGFHLRREILTAAGADEIKLRALSVALYNGKWSEMTRLLTALRDDAAVSRKSAILEVQKYLNTHCRGIRARR